MNSIEDRLDTLESVVDEQQAQIEAHEETIAAQQETIKAQRERLAAVENDGGVSMPISRRSALAAGGALGLLGVGAGTASAAGSGQIGTSDTPVKTVYAEALNGGLTNSEEEIDNLLGWGLQIYSENNRSLSVDWDAATGLNQSGIPNRIFASEELQMTVTNDGEAGNIVAGHFENDIDTDIGGIIAGGGSSEDPNEIEEGANYATISGGKDNTASGTFATVPGGNSNTAGGDYSFAVGREAEATEPGSFVVGDSSEDPVTAANPNEARFQMNVVANAFELVDKQSEPNLGEGEGILYISDGEDDHEEGDLVYGYDADGDGTETVVIEDNPDSGGA